jgi:quercetin dioxygenase-like cupin family protein
MLVRCHPISYPETLDVKAACVRASDEGAAPVARRENNRGDKVMIAPVKVQWLYANESGLSRFDTFKIEREMTLFAPPAHPFPVSASTPASRFVVLQLPAGWSGERHRTPTRQILFCLAGSVRVTPGAGDAVTISAGDAWLMEDTTGSGHTTEVVSKGPFEAVVIQLPDDAPLGRA